MKFSELILKSGIFCLTHGWVVSRRRHEKTRGEQLKTGDEKHVVVLSQFYKPEPSKFPPHIAAALKEAGYRVSVVTGFPNRPRGELYPGYRQRYGFTEDIDGIRVHRVPLVINHSRRAFERISNFLSFSFSALMTTSIVKHADAVYVYATPATAGIPAQLWNKFYGIPYVLHVQDLWPESVTDSGMIGKGAISRLSAALMAPWLKRLYDKADALIAISPGMRELLVSRGNRAETTSVVFNWADEQTISTKSSNSFSESKLRLLYAGNLGPMQDLGTVIEAASRCDDVPGFKLEIAGGGILEDSLRTAAEGLFRTKFLGLLPRSEMGRIYSESDFQLVTLKDIPIFRTTVPSKLQSSLASGVPVITTVQGDVATLIEKYEAGLVAEPENVESLAAVFERALDMSAEERARMGRNARRLYNEKMSHATGTGAIVSIMDLVSRREQGDKVSVRSLAENEDG